MSSNDQLTIFHCAAQPSRLLQRTRMSTPDRQSLDHELVSVAWQLQLNACFYFVPLVTFSSEYDQSILYFHDYHPDSFSDFIMKHSNQHLINRQLYRQDKYIWTALCHLLRAQTHLHRLATHQKINYQWAYQNYQITKQNIKVLLKGKSTLFQLACSYKEQEPISLKNQSKYNLSPQEIIKIEQPDLPIDQLKSQVFKIGMVLLKLLRKGLNNVPLYRSDRLGIDWENVNYTLRFLEYYYSDSLTEAIKVLLNQNDSALDPEQLILNMERRVQVVYPKGTQEHSHIVTIRNHELQTKLLQSQKQLEAMQVTRENSQRAKNTNVLTILREDSLLITPESMPMSKIPACSNNAPIFHFQNEPISGIIDVSISRMQIDTPKEELIMEEVAQEREQQDKQIASPIDNQPLINKMVASTPDKTTKKKIFDITHEVVMPSPLESPLDNILSQQELQKEDEPQNKTIEFSREQIQLNLREGQSYFEKSLKRRNVDSAQKDPSIYKGLRLDTKKIQMSFLEEFERRMALKERLFGQIEYTDGSEYKGQYIIKKQEKQRQGIGIYRFINGDTFMGLWHDNQISTLDRPGLHIYSSGEIYLGRLSEENARRHQVDGTYVYTNGDVYKGAWRNQNKDGLGKYYYEATGDIYKGQWVQGYKQGTGSLYFRTGCVYFGQFRDNQPICQRALIIDQQEEAHQGWYADGAVVQATSQDWLVHPDGSLYKGGIQEGLKNGKGSYTFQQGDHLYKYQGQFKQDVFHGPGALYHLSSINNLCPVQIQPTLVYQGDFKAGHKDGWGRLKECTATTTKIYLGQFLLGNKQGQGQQVTQNNGTDSLYIGQFHENQRWGEGVVFEFKEQSIRKLHGNFVQDRLYSSIKEESITYQQYDNDKMAPPLDQLLKFP